MKSVYHFKWTLLPSVALSENLRKNSGYGCVVCGHPICYVADSNKRTVASENLEPDTLMLLCPAHFGHWNAGKSKSRKILDALARPYNYQNKRSENIPFGINSSEDILIKMGHGSTFWTCSGISEGAYGLIQVDEECYFGLKLIGQQLSLTFKLRDEFNNPLVSVKDNIIYYLQDTVKIFYLKNMLTVFKDTTVLFSLHYQYPNKVVLKSGLYLVNGLQLEIKDNMISLNGSELKLSGKQKGNMNMICIGQPEKENAAAFIQLPFIKRYLNE